MRRDHQFDGLAPVAIVLRRAGRLVANRHLGQVEINRAIAALPEAGGTVHLREGIFDICADPETFGGVVIERSNVRLTGEGPGTLLRLADRQHTNVIRIKGAGVQNIVIEDLRIDGNRANNPDCDGAAPPVQHSRFECSGIKAHYLTPADYRAGAVIEISKVHQRVWVRRVHVENANGLNIMLEGRYVYVHDSFLGDARSDSVELLIGPGQISRTTLVVDESTGYGLATDQASNVQINENLVHVTPTGTVLQSLIRDWPGFRNHQVNDNLVIVEAGAVVARLLEVLTGNSLLVGNLFAIENGAEPQYQMRFGVTSESNRPAQVNRAAPW